MNYLFSFNMYRILINRPDSVFNGEMVKLERLLKKQKGYVLVYLEC